MPPDAPNPEQEARAERFRRLIAYEIDRILGDLQTRRFMLLDVWGRHRDRGPFLDTLQSRWGTLGFPELALLEPDVLGLTERFYRELADFRLYMSFTTDMPSTLTDRYDLVVDRLQRVGVPAIEALGGVVLPDALERSRDPALRVGMPALTEPEPEPLAPVASVREVVYEEIEMNSKAVATGGGDSMFPPSPAQLNETDEEREARLDWRKNGKNFG